MVMPVVMLDPIALNDVKVLMNHRDEKNANDVDVDVDDDDEMNGLYLMKFLFHYSMSFDEDTNFEKMWSILNGLVYIHIYRRICRIEKMQLRAEVEDKDDPILCLPQRKNEPYESIDHNQNKD